MPPPTPLPHDCTCNRISTLTRGLKEFIMLTPEAQFHPTSPHCTSTELHFAQLGEARKSWWMNATNLFCCNKDELLVQLESEDIPEPWIRLTTEGHPCAWEGHPCAWVTKATCPQTAVSSTLSATPQYLPPQREWYCQDTAHYPQDTHWRSPCPSPSADAEADLYLEDHQAEQMLRQGIVCYRGPGRRMGLQGSTLT